MNRWTYKLDTVFAYWITVFILMAILLIISVRFNPFVDFSYDKALRNAFLFSFGGSLCIYIISVLAYPLIKEKDETNKAFERLKGR